MLDKEGWSSTNLKNWYEQYEIQYLNIQSRKARVFNLFPYLHLSIRSCFLRAFHSTTDIIYSKLFSLTLRKSFLLMWSFDDTIWNMISFLKTFGKLFLDFRFLMKSIENSSIWAFWCFQLRALYKQWLTSLCRTFAWMHGSLFYFCHLLCQKQPLADILQNRCS